MPEMKFGGYRRQIALALLRRNIISDLCVSLQKLADLLDIAVVNLKEAIRQEELRDGLLCMKLQKKLSATMLRNYHCCTFENHIDR